MSFERPDTPSSQVRQPELPNVYVVPPANHVERKEPFFDRHKQWLSQAMEKAYPPVGVTLAMMCTTLGIRAHEAGMQFEHHAFGAVSVVFALSSAIVGVNRLLKEKK